MSWFLYIITKSFVDEDGKEIKKDSAGVGQCSMSPGIMDAHNGIMYIVPEDYVRDIVRKKKMSASPGAGQIRRIIEDYYKKENVIEISEEDKEFFID